MNDSPAPPQRYAKIYLKEWIETAFSQKELAAAMKRSEGAISKKLKEPWKIDLMWLQEFADALRVSPLHLFSHPAAYGRIPAEARPALGELMDIASRASDQQISHLIGLLGPCASPQPGQPLDDPEARKETAQ